MSDDKDVFGNPWPAGAYIPLVGKEGDKAMTTPPLTPAQRAALEWLPRNGSWAGSCGKRNRSFLVLRRFMLVDCRSRKDGGYVDWRITPAGEALRKELNKS